MIFFQIEALRKLKAEVNIQKQETMLLRKALQECKACRIKRPECSDDPPPCFPKVECRDTNDGPVCGPCPQGLYTIATFTKDQSHDHLPLHLMVSNWCIEIFYLKQNFKITYIHGVLIKNYQK